MSERPTPETDYEQKIDNGDTKPLLSFARRLERERDEARELARELRDELVWKGKLVGLSLSQQRVIAKAKEVLP